MKSSPKGCSPSMKSPRHTSRSRSGHTYGCSMTKRPVDYLKPPRLKAHLTVAEVGGRVERDGSWLRLLEKEGRIPKAARVRRGQIEIRLWSPAQVDEIAAIIAQHKPGRPRSV